MKPQKRIGTWANISIITFILCTFSPIAKAGISLTTGNPAADKAFSYNYEMKPGEKKQNSANITNTGKETIKINLYGVDAISSGHNGFAAKSQNQEQRTIGKWIKFDTDVIQLPPQESRTVQYTIEIPKEISPGTYAGAIGATIGSNETIQNGMGVISISRTIIPLYVKIPGKEIYSYDWQSYTYEGGRQPHLNIEVANTGNTIISIDGTIDIINTDSPGTVLKSIPIETLKIYQDDTSVINKYIDDIPAQGIINNFKAEAKINISKIDIQTDTKLESRILSKTTSFSLNRLYLVYYGALILLGIIIITMMMFLLTRHAKKTALRYIIQEKDTLETISKQQNVSWKKIARMNKLKPPYSVKPGMEILIPKTLKKK